MSDMSDYQMPQVTVGEIVLHKPGINATEWMPMFVTDVFGTNIEGVTLQSPLRPGASNLKMNVVHITDPRVNDPHFNFRQTEEGDQGVFELHPFRLRMEGMIARLEKRLDELTRGEHSKAKHKPQPETNAA